MELRDRKDLQVRKVKPVLPDHKVQQAPLVQPAQMARTVKPF
jgi:hypothetical protein